MGAFHPQVVHFAIALLFVGVLFRAVSWLGRPQFVGPAATSLLILGTIAAIVAAYTGDAAHGPVEQMPGLRPAVEDHEFWGNWARNIFIVVVVAELVALALRNSPKARYALLTSTALGVVGLGALYEAGEHGGEVVYGYAGGVGTRSGDAQDVGHLLRAGLYQQALADRMAGRAEGAAALLDVAAQRFPDDVEVQLARAESLLLDRKNTMAALDALRSIVPPADNRAVRIRHGMLTADALVAAGQREGAIATLQQLLAAVPSPRVQQRLDKLKAGG
jgi:Predicted membrane protein